MGGVCTEEQKAEGWDLGSNPDSHSGESDLLYFSQSFHLSGQIRDGDSSGPKQMNSQSSGLWCQDGVGWGGRAPVTNEKVAALTTQQPCSPRVDFQPPASFLLPPYSQWEQHCKQRKGSQILAAEASLLMDGMI